MWCTGICPGLLDTLELGFIAEQEGGCCLLVCLSWLGRDWSMCKNFRFEVFYDVLITIC